MCDNKHKEDCLNKKETAVTTGIAFIKDEIKINSKLILVSF